MKCVKCNAELPDGSKFCKFCGTPQPQAAAGGAPQGLRCPKCGKELAAGSKFCKFCGATVGAAPQPAVSQTPPAQAPVQPAAPQTPPPVQAPVQPVPQPTPPPVQPTVQTPQAPVTPPTRPVESMPVQPAAPQTPPPVQPPVPPVTPPVQAPVQPTPQPARPPVQPPVPPRDPQAGYGTGMGPLTGPEKPQKKATGLLIGCIVAALVLVIAVVVLVFVFLNSGKDDPGREEPGVLEEREDGEESGDDAEEPENGEDEDEEPAPATGNGPEDVAPEELTGEEAFLEKQASGISGTVDYGTVSYEPQSADSNMSPEISDHVMALQNEGAFDYDQVLRGTLYSMSEDRDMTVKVYYHPETYEIERITTIQTEDDHLRMYLMIFDDGKIAVMNDVILDSSVNEIPAGEDYDPDALKGYAKKAYTLIYSGDALAALSIVRETGETETYLRLGFDSMDEGVQSLYLAREAEYLNRAYITYAAVTE